MRRFGQTCVVLALCSVASQMTWAAEIAVVVTSQRGGFGAARAAVMTELGASAQIYDSLSLDPDQLRIKLNKSPQRVLLAIGPRALRLAQASAADRPVVYCLTASPGSKGSGTIIGVPLAVASSEILKAVREAVPHAQRISAIFDPATSGETLRRAKEDARRLNVMLSLHPVKDRKDTRAVVHRALNAGDAIWLLPDRSMANREALHYLMLRSFEQRKPVITSFETVARQGAMLAVLPNPKAHGRAAARMARSLVQGQDLETIHPTALASRHVINLRTARLLSIKIPQSVVARADTVIR